MPFITRSFAVIVCCFVFPCGLAKNLEVSIATTTLIACSAPSLVYAQSAAAAGNRVCVRNAAIVA